MSIITKEDFVGEHKKCSYVLAYFNKLKNGGIIMLDRKFCNNGKCSDCDHPCRLDMSIPCSPDCENLTDDGKILTKQCIEAGCDAINIVFGSDDNKEIIDRYGEVSKYPYYI